jgi:hypothetical protein
MVLVYAYGAVNADQAIQYAEWAVNLARSEERIPAIEAARAGAELATAIFLRSPTRQGAADAFATWSEAANRMFESRDDSDEWKNLFVIFVHCTGYLASMAARGCPPSSTASGEEYCAPIRGAFLRNVPGRVALFRSSAVPAVMWMLSEYATASDDDQIASQWLGCVSSLTDPTQLRLVDSVISRDMIPLLISSNKYSEAIDAAVRSCHAAHAFGPNVPIHEAMEQAVDLAASWNEIPVAQRELIEQRAALLAVVPAACWVGRRMLEIEEEGIAQGRLLASACRQIGNTATDPILWIALADALDQMCREHASVQELVAHGNTFANSSRYAVAIVAYIGASLHGGPDDAFNAQLSVMQFLFQTFPPDSATHRELLLPFIECIWANMFEQCRFGFCNPSIVEAALSQARRVTVEGRIKSILRAIRVGVVSRADATATSWLNADS